MKKVPLSCLITKVNNNSHFHPSHFFFYRSQFSQPESLIFFLSLLPFLRLEIKKVHLA